MNLAPLLAVTLWSTVSSFFQVTFWPTFTDTLAGWNLRSRIPIDPAGREGGEPESVDPESELDPQADATAATMQAAAIAASRLT
jgi:hypothetical protein